MTSIFETIKSKVVKKDPLVQAMEEKRSLLDQVKKLKESLPKKTLSSNYGLEVLRVEDFEFGHRQLFTDLDTGKSYYEFPDPDDATTSEKVLNFNEGHPNDMVLLTYPFTEDSSSTGMFYEFEAGDNITAEHLSKLLDITVNAILEKKTAEYE